MTSRLDAYRTKTVGRFTGSAGRMCMGLWIWPIHLTAGAHIKSEEEGVWSLASPFLLEVWSW